MKIIVDTREQRPFRFEDKCYGSVKVEQASLQTGDYSLAGLTDRVAIERKKLDDFVACLGKDRDRFERELQRAASMDFFAVVIEGAYQELAQREYQKHFDPHSVCQYVAARMTRLHIPFLFAGTRSGAEYLTYSLLRQYLEGSRKRSTEMGSSQEMRIRATGAIVGNGYWSEDTGKWAYCVADVWTKYLRMVKVAQIELTNQDVAWMVDSLPQKRDW